jgi:tRNA threonylcarbamoyladenosine biosynthesis protein TsaE
MPILNEHSLDLISHSPEQTRRFGERLGTLLQAGDVICLEGELGTGKTCLTQGIGQGMGVDGLITSPTFILIAEHHPLVRGATLYHIDLYRLGAAVDEALAFGLDEYLGGDGVCVIEWADRVLPVLPNERLWVVLRHLDTSKRGIVMKAHGNRYDQILDEFRRLTFGV